MLYLVVSPMSFLSVGSNTTYKIIRDKFSFFSFMPSIDRKILNLNGIWRQRHFRLTQQGQIWMCTEIDMLQSIRHDCFHTIAYRLKYHSSGSYSFISETETFCKFEFSNFHDYKGWHLNIGSRVRRKHSLADEYSKSFL